MKKKLVVIKYQSRDGRAISPFKIFFRPIVTVGLKKEVTVIRHEIALNLAHAARRNLVRQLPENPVSRIFPFGLEVVRQDPAAEVGITPPYQDEVAHAALCVRRRGAFDGGAKDKIGAQFFQGRGGGKKFHVRRGHKKMLGILFEQDFSVMEAHHFNAPKTTLCRRLAQDVIDVRPEGVWNPGTAPFRRARRHAENERDKHEGKRQIAAGTVWVDHERLMRWSGVRTASLTAGWIFPFLSPGYSVFLGRFPGADQTVNAARVNSDCHYNFSPTSGPLLWQSKSE